jgi:serralysin
MAANSEAVVINPSGNDRIDGILSAQKWEGPVSFGDPGSASAYEAAYPEPLNDFKRINARQLEAAREMLTDVSPGLPGHQGFAVTGFTNLDITYDRQDPVIRLADTSDPATAYTYIPDDQPWGGDAFFGADVRAPRTGNYAWYTLLHELGHALGLKHGHESSGFGALPNATDSMEYSVMTYRSYVGSDARFIYNETWGDAQTYMMYDIAALQHLYGADFTTNAGATTYSWNPTTGATFVNGQLALQPGADRIFETIWDGGGTDTYDLSNYRTDLDVDLSPGGYSVLDRAQLADLGGGPNGGHARGNVFNAMLYHGDRRSLIENATGGSGDDTLRGNDANNALSGGAGRDHLIGGGGNDMLTGGTGLDRMEGGAGNDLYRVDQPSDVVVEAARAGSDTVLSTYSFRLSANVEALTLVGGRAGNLTGNELANAVNGNAAANRIAGLGGADTLTGGGGADTLIGGLGADVFRFTAVSQSTPSAHDTIRAGNGAVAFELPGGGAGDRIDLSLLDANGGAAGIQHFVFGGSHGVRHLWLSESDGSTLISGNVRGGGAPEFQLAIADGATHASAYTADDFIGLA